MRFHRPPQKEEAASGNTQNEPEAEPEHEDLPAEDGLVMPMGEEEDDTHPLPIQAAVPDPPPPAAHPTLDEYQARWAEKLEAHARPSPGPFSLVDLVPKKVPNLWQDCTHLSTCPAACCMSSAARADDPVLYCMRLSGPYVPFHELISDESQAHLSVCRPVSAFEPANVKEGVPRYSLLGGSSAVGP